ncbi:MAG: hypothetical protein JXL97_17030 [Bacteroidales bacterium]|nr:hypothetical protein [Bacteroidales bacterium]
MSEIERKFLLSKIPDGIQILTSVSISQCYILSEGDKIVRIRQIGDKFILGFKKGMGIERLEKEIEISESDFNYLKFIDFSSCVSKIRHNSQLGNYIAEIDEFTGRHKGLFIVEVEFPTLEEANKFVPPSWFGKEVTNEVEYTNVYLSRH